jgi:hypothetical protein
MPPPVLTFASAEAFPASVVHAESAICAWEVLKSDAAAPLPPLPVMVAAMLRRPQLEVLIEALCQAADSGQPIQLQSARDNDLLWAPFDREAIVRRHDPTDLMHLLRGCDDDDGKPLLGLPYLHRLCASGDLPGAFAALAQLAPRIDPLGRNVGWSHTESGPYMLIGLCSLAPMLIARGGDVNGMAACVRAGYNHKPDPTARCGMLEMMVRVHEKEEARLCELLLEPELATIVNSLLPARAQSARFLKEAKAWAASARAWKMAREVALSAALGDASNLTAQLPLLPNASHWARLLDSIKSLSAQLADLPAVMEALFALHRADVASALYCIAPHDSVPRTLDLFRRTASQLNRHDLRGKMIHHGLHPFPTSPLLLSAASLVVPVWSGAGDALLLGRDTTFLDDCLFLRPPGEDCGHVGPTAGAPAMVSRGEFEKRWAQLTGGALDGFDWRHIVAAGGAVVACLDPAKDVTALDHDLRPKDIDLFIHGLTPLGAKQVCCEIESYANAFAVACGVDHLTLLTTRTMTIVFDDKALPRLQIMLGTWESVDDVLSTADVDCCCVGFDGRDVVATARGVLAWTHRVNIGSDAHGTVGSCTYELRLWKYAHRHGFSVAAVVPSAAELTTLRAEMAARKTATSRPTNPSRGLATEVLGLRWMAAVDGQLLRPVTPPDQLALNGGLTFAELRARLELQGFEESDNYGQHEAGFMIVDSNGPALAFDHDRAGYRLEHSDMFWPRGEGAHDAPTYIAGLSPLPRDALINALRVTNHDIATPFRNPSWNARTEPVADEDR